MSEELGAPDARIPARPGRDAVTIRPFSKPDEPAVRDICYSTALYGRPISALMPDPELITTALIGYYLRFEPELLLTAQVDGKTAGYLAGCHDTLRFQRIYRRSIVPALALRLLTHGHWRSKFVWRLAWRSAAYASHWETSHRRLLVEYPAHLHVNVGAAYRGMGVGARLLARFLEDLRKAGIRGVHVSAASPEGAAFFRKLGFDVADAYPMASVTDGSAVEVTVLTLRT